jgi:hypothetical protein
VSLSSLGEGLTIVLGGLRPMEEPKQCSIFSNSWHFALYVSYIGRMGVACPFPTRLRRVDTPLIQESSAAIQEYAQPRHDNPPSSVKTSSLSYPTNSTHNWCERRILRAESIGIQSKAHTRSAGALDQAHKGPPTTACAWARM